MLRRSRFKLREHATKKLWKVLFCTFMSESSNGDCKMVQIFIKVHTASPYVLLKQQLTLEPLWVSFDIP